MDEYSSASDSYGHYYRNRNKYDCTAYSDFYRHRHMAIYTRTAHSDKNKYVNPLPLVPDSYPHNRGYPGKIHN
jgi:hypothetical protein